MKSIRNLTQRYPIVFSFLVTLALYFIPVGINALFPNDPSYFYNLSNTIVHIAWPVMLSLLVGYSFIYTKKGFTKTFKAGLACIIIYSAILLYIIITTLSSPNVEFKNSSDIILSIISMLGVGIREEVLFRGLVVNSLSVKYGKSVKGLWLIVVISALAFGGVHMFGVLRGVTLASALVQSLCAASLGALFGAIYLRGGNLWFFILLHAIIDSYSLFNSSFLASKDNVVDQINDINLSSLLFNVPCYILMTIFLLRKSKQSDIFERLKQLRQSFGYQHTEG